MRNRKQTDKVGRRRGMKILSGRVEKVAREEWEIE